MSHIKEMTDEALVYEFERIINRIHSYSASGEFEYKRRLKDEILKRLVQQKAGV